MRDLAAVVLLLLGCSDALVLDACSGPQCPGPTVHLTGMVEVVAHFSFTRVNPDTGKRGSHVIMIQRNVDPATSAQHSCDKLNIPELECQRLIDEAKRRWSDAVERPPPAAAPSVHLLVQYYNDKYPPRQEELDACMRFNLANPHVIKIHNLIEPQTVLPAWAANHPKMVVVRRPAAGRLMFDEALEYASTTLPANSSAMLSNLDTYLDHHSPWDRFGGTLEGWTSGVSNKTISLALSRYEADLDGSLWRNADLAKSAYSIAQDAWLVKTPISVPDAHFAIGNCPGSDNAIADRLARAGHDPLNLSHLFRVYHLDVARKKASADVLPAMLVTQGSDLSRPHLRGNRILPAYGEVSKFSDLKNFGHMGWVVDPLMEYLYVLDYLSQVTDIGQKFVKGGVIKDDYSDIEGLKKIWAEQKRKQQQAQAPAPAAVGEQQPNNVDKLALKQQLEKELQQAVSSRQYAVAAKLQDELDALDNQSSQGEAAAAIRTLELTVPAEFTGGKNLNVKIGDRTYSVKVPDGLGPGDTFKVGVPKQS